ncbi:hypothetical protein T01_5642 [Trichinella spiralis]|uniref:Uncharacterized protein n=1 Tax=Trichinella spiralis TaxID=6334 RepID=A0A0V1BGC4_TRISP|nr:hypothetical protein T01_5642 [Trichinella spiralis]
MDPNWKGMKSLMDFYPKSESNAKTGRDAPTDLANESPQQPRQSPSAQKEYSPLYSKSTGIFSLAAMLKMYDKQTSEALYTNIEITSVIYPLGARHKELPGRRTLGL